MSAAGRVGATVLAVLAACRSARPDPASGAQPDAQSEARAAAGACTPPSGTLPSTATAAGLAGGYRLHLTATSGPKAGRTAEGSLRLRPVTDSLARTVVVLGIRDSTSSHPLAGTAEFDPEAVGGVHTGDLGAEDPEAPGVLVIERHPARPGAAAEIMLRLGADANRRGVVSFDGGYFALTVRSIGRGGFAGTWASGAGRSSGEGYFCAERE